MAIIMRCSKHYASSVKKSLALYGIDSAIDDCLGEWEGYNVLLRVFKPDCYKGLVMGVINIHRECLNYRAFRSIPKYSGGVL